MWTNRRLLRVLFQGACDATSNHRSFSNAPLLRAQPSEPGPTNEPPDSLTERRHVASRRPAIRKRATHRLRRGPAVAGRAARGAPDKKGFGLATVFQRKHDKRDDQNSNREVQQALILPLTGRLVASWEPQGYGWPP